MKSFALILACVFAFLASSNAFTAPNPAVVPRTAKVSVTSLNVFGNKKSAASKAVEDEKASKYWQGEWVCKDCGYVDQLLP